MDSGTETKPSLAAIFRAFLTIGMISFGGGRQAYFQDALVSRRKWISEAEFLEAVAVSQVLPGPNIGNLAAYLGQRLHGVIGAIVAVACLTVPGAVMIVALAWFYFHGMPASITGPVGEGVAAAAVGLAGASVLRLRGGVSNIAGWGIAALTFVLFGPLQWPVFIVLLLVLPPSFALAMLSRRRTSAS